MRILVVEDDSLLAQGLTRVLARAGHAVDRAETGVQADRALRAASYPQRKPVSCAWTGSGLDGRPSTGSTSL